MQLLTLRARFCEMRLGPVRVGWVPEKVETGPDRFEIRIRRANEVSEEKRWRFAIGDG
jgi:hypothetical protein